MTNDTLTRCGWANPRYPHYIAYHDEEWGTPSHDDRHLFEMLVLEGAQAGLNWETILRRRDHYRELFHGFDPAKVAAMSDDELEAVLQDARIIRNRLKVYSARRNARVYLRIQQEYGSFAAYLWGFVGGRQKVGHYRSLKEVPITTPESDALSKDLKKRGMNFVGSTIIYAYMQAVGLVDDHIADCWRRKAG